MAPEAETSAVPKSLDDLEFIVNPPTNGEEWRQISEWCARTEGWNFAFSDYDSWLSTFEQFWYFMAIEKDTKEAIGSLTLGRICSSDGDSSKDLYSVGMYYVRPEWRGSGVGTKLFDRLMHIAGDHNMCLNAVLKMSPLYASRYGFDKFLAEVPHLFYEAHSEKLRMPKRTPSIQTFDVSEVDFDRIHEFDQTIMPNFDRRKYLQKMVTTKEAHTRVALDGAGAVVGLCCIRETGPKLTAGPFYAPDGEIARTLMHDTLQRIDNWREFKSVGSMAPSLCEDAKALFDEMNAGEPSGSPFCVLQFTKEVLPAEQKKCYGMIECAMSFI